MAMLTFLIQKHLDCINYIDCQIVISFWSDNFCLRTASKKQRSTYENTKSSDTNFGPLMSDAPGV